MEWLGRRKYQALLVALLSMIVGYPMLRGVLAARVVYDGLLTVVFLVTLLTVFDS